MNTDPYRKFAKRYDRMFGGINTALRKIGLKMFPPEEGTAVLDIACGTGDQLEYYQKAGCQVFGIDLSPSMLQMARYRLGESANLYLGDASNMPFSDRSFDLITISTALHEMPRTIRSAVLKEAIRTLKERGRILLTDFHPGPISSIKGWFHKAVISFIEIAAGREHFRNYRDFMASKGLPALIEKHGLSIEKEKIISGGNIALFLVY
jgi:ubiquinone/menaquinone biosynthesis C-methylase UbiE